MKRIVFFSLILTFLVSSMSCEAQNKKATKAKTAVSDKIEVFYFHYTRRCITCNAVENVTKEAIAEMYPTQTKKGQIIFTSINLDNKENEAIAKKCQSEGQSLLFIGKGKRIDLTDKGFMYAKSSPDKLKAEVKKTIDALL
ncbi:MAG TPA: nitrophenyl compound nitroreductase subunit ArsF family protein [Paludibacter sp.]|nr:nitrophenyl compound nitroreductase subunit ArsF family protein [Paludibacter sp.]